MEHKVPRTSYLEGFDDKPDRVSAVGDLERQEGAEILIALDPLADLRPRFGRVGEFFDDLSEPTTLS